VLQRSLRDHADKIDSDAIEQVSNALVNALRRLQGEHDLDTVRGIEGDSANRYFEVFDQLITCQKDEFRFNDRNRRPPLDNVNCLLSFLYTILMHDVRSALESVGLDPAVGFLHRDRPGRYGLALDIMEEFRPFLADRLALSLINLCQVQSKGFNKKESGAVLMDDDTRKTLLIAYQKRKQEEIEHPYLKEKMAIGLLPYAQALLMARYLRGDIDGYPPFIWK
jgi:CRISPR-associated protein Cas1